MNREDIIHMAREAFGVETIYDNDIPRLERFAALVAAAQRQWVGLTERETKLLDGMIAVQLDHAARCDGIANRTMAEKQKGWDMERVALLQKLKEKNT
jgi:hypothetical protein